MPFGTIGSLLRKTNLFLAYLNFKKLWSNYTLGNLSSSLNTTICLAFSMSSTNAL